MAFNLAAACGFDDLVSNLDTREIEEIPVSHLIEHEDNFFSVDDVQDLKESIEIHGILQPLILTPAGAAYRIIAGHRRYKAAQEIGLETVPAIVMPEMSESMEMMLLIQTNTTARELSYSEKMEAARVLTSHLLQLKAEGVKFTGRLRDKVSEQLEISKTELARMQVIEKNLIPEGKALLKAEKMTPSAAYAMARTSPECQKEIIDSRPASFVASFIEEYAAKRELDYLNPDCEHPSGWWQHEEKRRGNPLPCPAWKRIKEHKDKGHPEQCPGCCAKCEALDHGYRCPDVCENLRIVRLGKIRAETERKAAERQLEERKAREAHFAETPFVCIGEQVRPIVDSGDMTLADIAERWNFELDDLLPDDTDDGFDESHVASMIHAKSLDDVDWPIAAFLAFCRAVDKTPNALLGYPDGAAGGWHNICEDKPADGQKVIVYRQVGTATLSGIYVWRNDHWYFPELADSDDDPADIKGVLAWIELPEGA
jgi:ParB/RepB/Spo0J family partition protein